MRLTFVPGASGQKVLYGMASLAAGWAVISPAFVVLPVFENVVMVGGVQTSVETTNAVGAGKLGEALGVLTTVALFGVAAFVATRMFLQGRRGAQYAMMSVAAAFFVLTILTAETVGPLLIGPAVLLMFPALWLTPHKQGSRSSVIR